MASRSRQLIVGDFKVEPIRFVNSNFPEDLERVRHGGKLILPHSALQRVTRWDVSSPFILKLEYARQRTTAFCGVLSFERQDKALVPDWVLQQLKVSTGDTVKIFVLRESIPVGRFAKFQPQSLGFLNVRNPKEVLERSLSQYTCLTMNDVIDIVYQRTVHKLLVTKTDPSTTITIVDCDLTVDFEPPPGYQEALRTTSKTEVPKTSESSVKKLKDLKNDTPNNAFGRGIPDFDYRIGTLVLHRGTNELTALNSVFPAGSPTSVLKYTPRTPAEVVPKTSPERSGKRKSDALHGENEIREPAEK